MTAGFTEETFGFLADLEAHNAKDWFDANRDRYEAHWKAPGLAFVEAMRPRLAALDPALRAEARINASLRRINRDVRFSADKSPYMPALHLIFSTGGAFNRDPGMHLVLTPGGVGYGAGLYGLAPDVLARYRDRVCDPAAAGALVHALDRAATVGARLGEPDLARPPKGYAAEGRAADLLRHRSIVVRTFGNDAPPSAVIGPGAVDWAIGTTEAFLPLLAWLREI